MKTVKEYLGEVTISEKISNPFKITGRKMAKILKRERVNKPGQADKDIDDVLNGKDGDALAAAMTSDRKKDISKILKNNGIKDKALDDVLLLIYLNSAIDNIY